MTTTQGAGDDLRRAAAAWAADDPDPHTRAEIEQLLATGDDKALADRFSTRLEFGTAGLRGKLGAGPNRMNRALVRRAAAGLARYLHDVNDGPASVVIGYDARHQSDEFAADSAAVMAGAGILAEVLPGPLPTPLLAYAIRHLGASAGVMVTASHNPAEYNGYKVYLGDGAQIIPPVDTEISARIGAVTSVQDLALAPPDDPRICHLGDAVIDDYLAEALKLCVAPGPRELRIVYTAMHGVGGPLTTRLLASAGFGDIHVVSSQFDPDPDFPTVAFPNPEEPGALDLAFAEARHCGADLVLANDPDADRLGAAVVARDSDGGEWQALSGDHIGVLLADHLLRHTAGPDRMVVTSIVSSTMLSKMAAAEGVHFVETLTGFKWLARSADAHPDWRFIFGYEEALGYSVGTLVRDKDGMTAAVVFAELVAALKAEGRSVHDRLDDLERAFGAHVTKQWSSVLAGADGPARIQGIVDRLRSAPPTELDGIKVTEAVDLLRGSDHLPPTEGVVLHLGAQARVIVRPSGTEPKVKIYFEVVAPVAGGDVGAARRRGAEIVARLQRALAALTGLPAPGGR